MPNFSMRFPVRPWSVPPHLPQPKPPVQGQQVPRVMPMPAPTAPEAQTGSDVWRDPQMQQAQAYANRPQPQMMASTGMGMDESAPFGRDSSGNPIGMQQSAMVNQSAQNIAQMAQPMQKAMPAMQSTAMHSVPGTAPNTAGQTGIVPVRGIVNSVARY